MNRIELAKKHGCLHCIVGTSFIEEMIDNKKTLTCTQCGCVHYEDGFSYRIPTKNFEPQHQFVQRSYRENEELMENYRKNKAVQEELSEDN